MYNYTLTIYQNLHNTSQLKWIYTIKVKRSICMHACLCLPIACYITGPPIGVEVGGEVGKYWGRKIKKYFSFYDQNEDFILKESKGIGEGGPYPLCSELTFSSVPRSLLYQWLRNSWAQSEVLYIWGARVNLRLSTCKASALPIGLKAVHSKIVLEVSRTSRNHNNQYKNNVRIYNNIIYLI